MGDGDLVVRHSTNGSTFAARGVFDQVTGAYTSVSDRRLKKNIAPLEDDTLAKVEALPLKRYHFKHQPDDTPPELGLIAQDLQQHYPSLVADGETLTVNYAGLSVVALKAIQEQQAIIEKLTARLEALEAAASTP